MSKLPVRPTVKDVAKKANVSPMTVSLALRNSPRISGTTRNNIHHIAREMGYQPNITARSLRGARTHMVACLLPSKNSDHFGPIFDGIQAYFDTFDYYAMMALTGDSAERTSKLLDHCVGTFDGIILNPVADLHANEYFFERFKQVARPFLVVGPFVDYDVDCVVNDEEEGVAEIIRWFVRNGHKRIAWVSGTPYRVDEVRLKGYKKVLGDNNLEISDDLIHISTEYWGAEAGYLGTKRLLRKHSDFTAIFADADYTAIGVYRALFEAGLRVPDDVSVIGYGNTKSCLHMEPPLSSVEQAPGQLGLEIAKLMIRRLQGDVSDFPKQVLVPTSLIIRESCLRANVKDD
jgi:LacI family transcriptional regulator